MGRLPLHPEVLHLLKLLSHVLLQAVEQDRQRRALPQLRAAPPAPVHSRRQEPRRQHDGQEQRRHEPPPHVHERLGPQRGAADGLLSGQRPERDREGDAQVIHEHVQAGRVLVVVPVEALHDVRVEEGRPRRDPYRQVHADRLVEVRLAAAGRAVGKELREPRLHPQHGLCTEEVRGWRGAVAVAAGRRVGSDDDWLQVSALARRCDDRVIRHDVGHVLDEVSVHDLRGDCLHAGRQGTLSCPGLNVSSSRGAALCPHECQLHDG